MSDETTFDDSRAAASMAGKARDHIIDKLIEERAPKLSNTAYWPLLRRSSTPC